MVKELQALALDVNVLDADGNVVELSGDDDDDPNIEAYNEEFKQVNDGFGPGYSEIDAAEELMRELLEDKKSDSEEDDDYIDFDDYSVDDDEDDSLDDEI